MISYNGSGRERSSPWRPDLILQRAAAMAGLLLATAGGASAAVIQATPSTFTIDVAEQVVVEVAVQLGLGETASIFEADIQLVGLGTIAGVTLNPGGPTWPNADGNVAGGMATLSLTSNNAGGTRRVGQLTVTGAHGGTLELRLGQDTILQRDIASDPFVEDVPLATAAGTLLASIEVVPEPGSLAIGASALAALLARRRPAVVRGSCASAQRRRAFSRSSTATKFS